MCNTKRPFYSSMFTKFCFISSSIARYLKNALEPSLWPDSFPIKLGSCTFLYRLPINVLRARWLLASSFRGCCSSFPVVEFHTVTIRVIPHKRKTSLMESLYFWAEMNGSNLWSVGYLSAYRFNMLFAVSLSGTSIESRRSWLVLCGM